MRFFHLKRSRSLRSRSEMYPIYGLGAVALALAVALVVVIALGARNAREVNYTRDQLKASIQSDLTMMSRAYEGITLPKADVQGAILPTMRRYLYSAYTLNSLLVDVYGANQSIIDDDFYNRITTAMDTMDKNLAAGQLIDFTTGDLSQAMADMSNVMAEHFGDESMQPKTAMR